MGRRHLLFASYEIHPVTAGGCGVFLWHALNELLGKTDYDLTLLLDIPKFECEEFIQKYKVNMPNHERLKVVCLTDRIPYNFLPMDSFQNIFLFKSYMFYEVIKQIVHEQRVDYIEFFDYVGIGYFTINAKKYEDEFKDTVIGIRGHCTVDLMDLEQRQVDFSKEKLEMYQIEKLALQNADVVVVQTEAWKALYAQRYGIDIESIVVIEPPMDLGDFPKYEPQPNKNVLFYGRVFQLKGIDEYIQAGVQYLKQHKDNHETKFYVVGYDGKTEQGTSYTEYVKAFIPEELKERFVFTGKLNREAFKAILDDICLAVFPNYVESFCYSIHELYEAGVPIICRDIPAFSSYFEHEKNCLMYEDGINQLTNCISLLLENETLQSQLKLPYNVLKRNDLGLQYEEILKLKGEENQLEEIVGHQEYARIYVSNSLEKVDFKAYLEERGLEQKTSEQFYMVYINEAFSPEANMESIQFLGKPAYVQAYRAASLFELNEIVLIQMVEAVIEEPFVQKAKQIINHHKVDYVMSASESKYPKYAIYQEKSSLIYNHLETMVINNKKHAGISELFDFRSGVYGQLDYLQGNGYIIPRKYEKIVLEHPTIQGNKEQLIFAINNQSKKEQWKPLELFYLLEKKVIESEKMEYSFQKKIYHLLRDQLYQSNNELGKIGLKSLERLKNIYVNLHKK